MTDDDLPQLDLTMTREEMLSNRDAVRKAFVARFHQIHIAMRAFRKVHDREAVMRLSAELQRVRKIIHSLDNPMEESEPPTQLKVPDLE